MQCVEVSVTGVRSAVITLRRPGTPMCFVLFPMIHLGTPAFYQAVARRLAECDLIVAEGVSGNSVLTQALALAYRLPARNRRLGLVTQSIDTSALAVPVMRPDLSARQSRLAWRAVPALQRLAVLCVVPFVALAFSVFGSRRVLARGLAQEDLPAREEAWLRQSAPDLVALVVDKRDALLLDALAAVHEERQADPIAVAVVYGLATSRA